MEPTTVQDFLKRIRGVHIGVDIGQKVDYTAIVVAEVGERPGPQQQRDWRTGDLVAVPESTYRIHELRRLPLGTSFVAVAQELVKVVASIAEMEKRLRLEGYLTPYERSLPVDIWVDATGVGAPVVELMTNALQVSKQTDHAYLHPITFTYGDKFDRVTGSLGKAHLVSCLQVLLEQDRLELPQGDPQIDDMVEELKNYEIRVDTDANEKYGAFTVGQHDDMTTALGLACVEEPGFYSMEAGPNIWP